MDEQGNQKLRVAYQMIMERNLKEICYVEVPQSKRLERDTRLDHNYYLIIDTNLSMTLQSPSG